MSNPEFGSRKLGIERRGNEKPTERRIDQAVQKALGKTALKGEQKKDGK